MLRTKSQEVRTKISENKDNVNSKKIEEELSQRIFQLYAEKSKSFQRSFSILIGFGLVFFFIILLPYVSILNEKHDTKLQQDSLSEEIDQTDRAFASSKALENGVQRISDAIETIPIEVKDYILTVTNQDKNDFQQDNVELLFQSKPLEEQIKSSNDSEMASASVGDCDICFQNNMTKNEEVLDVLNSTVSKLLEGYEMDNLTRKIFIYFNDGKDIINPINSDLTRSADLAWPKESLYEAPVVSLRNISMLPSIWCSEEISDRLYSGGNDRTSVW